MQLTLSDLIKVAAGGVNNRARKVIAARPDLALVLHGPHEIPSPHVDAVHAVLSERQVKQLKGAVNYASGLPADEGLHYEHEARRGLAVAVNRKALTSAGIPAELHDAIITHHAVTQPELWEQHTPGVVQQQQHTAAVVQQRAVQRLALPSTPAGATSSTQPPPTPPHTTPLTQPPGTVHPPAGPASTQQVPAPGAGKPGPVVKPKTPRVPDPNMVALSEHFSKNKYRYAGAAGVLGLGAAALHHYRQHRHENEVAALHEAAKTAATDKKTYLPKEIADPFGQLNVHMSDGADYGAIVGSVVPVAGPLVGGLVGKAVGAVRGIQAHGEAAERYEHETGQKLALPARHPFGVAALSTAGLFPLGAGPMGPAVAMGLARATRPKDREEAPVDKREVLSRPYALLAAQQAPGAIIGGGVGGTAGTLAGRHYGLKHTAVLNDSLTHVVARAPHMAVAGIHPLSSLAATSARIGKVNLQPRTYKYSLGLGGAALGILAGSTVGKIPGIVSTMQQHRQIADAYEKETGARLPGLTKSPYVPYIAAGALAGPVGLSGLKNKSFDLALQYKMDPASNNKNSIGEDAHGFADYLHKRWFR